jgi:hypothetical protein
LGRFERISAPCAGGETPSRRTDPQAASIAMPVRARARFHRRRPGEERHDRGPPKRRILQAIVGAWPLESAGRAWLAAANGDEAAP